MALKDVLYGVYVQNGGGKLRHEGIGDVAVLPDSMGHSVSSGNTKIKASILTDPDVMGKLFRAGRSVPAHIRHADVTGQSWEIDHNKDNWQECWHVRGKAILAIPGKGTRTVHYDFTVYRRADNGKCALYDLAVEDR